MSREPQGSNHWSHTAVPLVLATAALGGALYCLWRIFHGPW
jgi:hypothetical protein